MAQKCCKVGHTNQAKSIQNFAHNTQNYFTVRSEWKSNANFSFNNPWTYKYEDFLFDLKYEENNTGNQLKEEKNHEKSLKKKYC